MEHNVRGEIEHPYPRWQGIIGRGRYIDQLEHLARFVPKHRLHVMIMEEWTRDPASAICGVHEFLELTPHDVPIVVSHQRRHTVAEPSEEAIAGMREMYRETNERLFDWIQREIKCWS